nr:glycosyltransferase family 9 protein [Arthrobacter roseus]
MLVLRALKLGDLLVSVPALRALRHHYPGHRITYAGPTWLQPILALTGSVDNLLGTPSLEEPLNVPSGAIDVAVNLHGSGPQSHRRLDVLAPKERMGYAANGWSAPLWRDDVHERNRWTDLLNWYGIPADPLDYRLLKPPTPSAHPGAVVVHPGAAYGSRLWPADRFAAVVRALQCQGHTVVLTGSADERERAMKIADDGGLARTAVLAGKLNLTEFAGVVSAAALVISADTGAAHLATAYGTPSVTIFGPAPVAAWGPPDGPHIALTDESVRVGNVFGAYPDPALLAITVEQVLSAAERLGISGNQTH